MSGNGVGGTAHRASAKDPALDPGRDGDELRLALELCPDPVALVDADARLVAWSAAWVHALGHRDQALEGSTFDELVHPDDRMMCIDVIVNVAVQRRSTAAVDFRVRAGEGGWRWFEWTVRPDPGRRRAYLWGRDVDARRAAERRQRMLLEHAPDLLAVVNAAGELTYRSRDAGPQVPGADTEVGERVFSGVHPEDLPLVLEEFARAFDGDATVAPFEVRIRRADGSWGPVEIMSANCVDVAEIGGMLVQARDISARRQADADLRARKALYERLIEAAPCALFELDADGRLVHANRAWGRITGHAPEVVVGRHWTDLPNAGVKEAMSSAARGWTARGHLSTTVALTAPDGGERWVRVNLAVQRAEDGTIERHLGSIEDVSATMHDIQAGGLQTVLEATPDIVLAWEEGGRIRYANAAARRILGIGRLGHIEVDDVYAPAARQRLAQVVPTLPEVGVWTGELALVAADGHEIPVSQVMVHHETDDGVGHVSAVARDISEHKRREEELAHRATHDPLTGLPNRVLFLERLRHALLRDGSPVAVAFFDVDRFKLINDSLGHEVGDHLLVALGKRLESLLRPGDTVARLGGDEFVVLCERVDGEREALAFADRIREAVGQPFPLSAGTVFVTASVGVATGAAVSAETLLEQADLAMYRAKDQGRGRTELFDAELRTGAAARVEIEAALRGGIDRGELRIFYQPQYSLRTSALVGMEALVRWQHPDLGLVSPMEFIPVAEESGLIVATGAYVLDEACRQVREWEERFPASAAMEIHVNLSARQFAQPDLVHQVAGALSRAGVSPGRLCLEITESVLMDDVESTMATLVELRALGVKVGVDDFGTGYSSLSYLKRLPVDVLKIDKSFVARLGEDMVDSAIVSSVVNLARSLGIAVVAEGVETDQQRLELRALGCPVAQGYYFSRPLSPQAAGELVASESWR